MILRFWREGEGRNKEAFSQSRFYVIGMKPDLFIPMREMYCFLQPLEFSPQFGENPFFQGGSNIK